MQRGQKELAAHIAGLNQRLGHPYMPAVAADFAAALKGLRTVDSLKNAVDTLLANVKISSSATADRIQANMQTLVAAGDAASFHDAATLVLKAPDDLRAVIAQRAAEAERQIQEYRQRIQAEEQAKAEAAARTKLMAEQAAASELMAASQPKPLTEQDIAEGVVDAEVKSTPNVVRLPTPQESATRILAARIPEIHTAAPTLKLGQIGERLGFALTGDFLKTLGFEPVARDKSALLFHESSFTHICAALVHHINTIQAKQAA